MSLKNTYEREIERKPVNNIVFSFGLAFVIVTLTIIFGIRPVVLAVNRNSKYKTELNEIKTNMETKIEKTSEGQKVLTEMPDKVEIINKKVPTDPNFQEFLEELVKVTANYGFVIQQARKESGEGDKYIVSARLEGEIEKLPKLLSGLENEMPRFISIAKLRTQQQAESDFELVEIIMETYTL